MPPLQQPVLAALALAVLLCAAPVRGVRSGRAGQFESPGNALTGSAMSGTQSLAELTLSLWIRVSAAHALNDLMVTYANTTSGTRYFTFDTGSSAWGAYLMDSSIVAVTEGFSEPHAWQHAVVTWRSSDGLTVFYRNGLEVGNATDLGTGLVFPPGNSLVLPDRQWGLGVYLLVDEVSLFDAALIPSEVAALHSGRPTRREARALHWDFDQEGRVADDGARATGDAGLSDGWGGDVTVPSTCPDVDTGTTWVVAQPGVPERVALRERWDAGPVVALALPRWGELVHEGSGAPVRVGDAVDATFATTAAAVRVQRNSVPVPHDEAVAVPQGRTALLFTAFADWWGLTDKSPDRFTQQDNDSDALSVFLVALPALGRLYQVLDDDLTPGDPVAAVPALVRNVNSLVLWDPAGVDVFANASFAVVASDGRSNSSAAVFTLTVGLPIDPPTVVSVRANMTEDGGAVVVDMAVVGDPLGQTAIIVTGMPRGSLFDYDASAPGGKGAAIESTERAEILHQWAVAANCSSFWPNYPAERVLGPPDWYPSYGDSPLTWTPVTNGLVDEWLLLEYQHPVFATDVVVYETYSTDSVWRVSLLLEETGQWVDAFQRPKRTDASPEEARVFSPPLLQGFFPFHTRAVLLSVWGILNDAVEIDAVKLVGIRSTPAAPVASGRRVVYEPRAFDNGVDTFAFTIDSTGASQLALLERVPFFSSPEQAVVAIDIAPVENPPILDNPGKVGLIDGLVSEGGSVEVAINGSDPDGDRVLVSVDTVPHSGDLVDDTTGAKLRAGATATSVSYRPRCSWTHPDVTDAFALRLSDGALLSAATKRFAVHIECDGMRARRSTVIAVSVCIPVAVLVLGLTAALLVVNHRANRARVVRLEMERAGLLLRAAELERKVAGLDDEGSVAKLLQTPAETAVNDLTTIMANQHLSVEEKEQLEKIIRLIRRNKLYEVKLTQGLPEDEEVAAYILDTVMGGAVALDSPKAVDEEAEQTEEAASKPIVTVVEIGSTSLPGQATTNDREIMGALALTQVSRRQLVSGVSRLLGDWDFHPSYVELRPGVGPLSEIALAIMEARGLVERFTIPREALSRWLVAIETGYRDNPYHNAVHAADVTQAMNWLLGATGNEGQFSDVELLAVVTACAIHDFAHPGVTANFLWASRNALALQYNGVSVLESMHVAEAFNLMLRGHKDLTATAKMACATATTRGAGALALAAEGGSDAYNWMAQVPRDVFDQFHRLVVQLVMATDMAQHVAILGEANTALAGGGQLNWRSATDRLLLLRLMIKVADLSNAFRPWKHCEAWAAKICAEFFAQGDQERALGLPVSPFMDRATANVPKVQVTFLDLLVRPLLDVLVRAVPQASPLIDSLRLNRTQWARQTNLTNASICTAARSCSKASVRRVPPSRQTTSTS
eukprot:m51a1_g6503 hypothetical protein (1410) ;mRNA; f:215860-220370